MTLTDPELLASTALDTRNRCHPSQVSDRENEATVQGRDATRLLKEFPSPRPHALVHIANGDLQRVVPPAVEKTRNARLGSDSKFETPDDASSDTNVDPVVARLVCLRSTETNPKENTPERELTAITLTKMLQTTERPDPKEEATFSTELVAESHEEPTH